MARLRKDSLVIKIKYDGTPIVDAIINGEKSFNKIIKDTKRKLWGK